MLISYIYQHDTRPHNVPNLIPFQKLPSGACCTQIFTLNQKANIETLEMVNCKCTCASIKQMLHYVSIYVQVCIRSAHENHSG